MIFIVTSRCVVFLKKDFAPVAFCNVMDIRGGRSGLTSEVKVKVKQSYYRPGPEGSRRLRLPDFKAIGT
jgi:hypothetical protein